MRKFTRPFDSGGDTIVEVLIVLAVLGAALGTSYSIANASLRQARDAQERSEVTGILQGQLEDLRLEAADPNSTIFSMPGNGAFCFNGSLQPLANNWRPVDWTADQDFSNFFDRHYAGCIDGFYHYRVTPLGGNLFEATGRWLSNDNSGRIDEVDMFYKVYPPQS